MQTLEPEIVRNEDGDYMYSFLISTRKNKNGWQIAKETGRDLINTFLNKNFIIVPEYIFKKDGSKEAGGHYFGEDTLPDLLQGYENHSHGVIKKLDGPFSYSDGTDDYFYKADTKLKGSKAAAALMEHGPKTWKPFSVSPHIWPKKEVNGLVTDWEGVGLALVYEGAYGDEAVISQYCSNRSCKSLAASVLCDKEDSQLADMISSLVSKSASLNTMSTVQVTEQVPISNQPVKEEVKKEDNTELIESLKKQLETAQKTASEKEETVTKLLNKDKTNTLNSIFKTVKDDTVRESLVQKYFDQDTDKLNDFAKDFQTHVVPSLIEEAKIVAESELKSKTIEESKGKSKAASLPKEPEIPQESKAASTPVNEVRKFHQLIRGFQ